jgi:hypothetical protein
MPLEARVLLGWMERDLAVKFLSEDCEFKPPLTKERAVELWAEFQARINALTSRIKTDKIRIIITD